MENANYLKKKKKSNSSLCDIIIKIVLLKNHKNKQAKQITNEQQHTLVKSLTIHGSTCRLIAVK